jgi:hypothetical protein
MKNKLLLLIVMPICVTGCSYKVSAPIAPSYDVYSSYSDKVPGRWVVMVDGGQLKEDFKVSGYVCSAHTFPLDASQAFNASVTRTLENVVEYVEDVQSPLSRDQLASSGYAGLIRVSGEEIDADLEVVPGFWSAGMKAEVQLTAALAVDGPNGRLLGGRLSSEGNDDAEAGGACEGGAQAISKATEKALRRLMEELGEKISNEPRLREGSQPALATYRQSGSLDANVSQPARSIVDPYAIDP